MCFAFCGAKYHRRASTLRDDPMRELLRSQERLAAMVIDTQNQLKQLSAEVAGKGRGTGYVKPETAGDRYNKPA